MADINSGNMHHSIVKSFDETSESLKTTIVNAAVDVTVSAFTDSIAIADASGNKVTTTVAAGKRGLDVNVTDITIDAANDSIAIKNGANQLAINADGSINVVGGSASTGLTDTQIRATALPVSGAFYPATQPVSAASLPLPTGAATETTLSALSTKIPSGLVVTAGRLQVELPAGGTGLTNTEIRATALPVSLASTTISNFPTTQAVSIASSVAVTGPLTNTELRLTPVPISGTVSTGLAQPLTDTQIRATALPVSLASTTITGSVATTLASTTITNFPASQAVTGAVTATLAAETIKVIGTVNVAAGQTIGVTGSFFQATQPISAVALPLPSGASTSANQTTTNASIASVDTKTPALGQALAAASTPVVLTAAQITTLTPLASVGVNNFPASQAVTGTFFQATQPVSIATMPSTPVTGTFFQATQPVSAAALPLPTGAATETTLSALNTKVTAVNTGAVTISTALPAGANTIGTVNPPAITKGTQGATGVSTQDLKDAGRNAVHYYTVIPVLSTATDTLQNLTGTKAGVTVVATTTPAVVTTGKTLRVTRVAATYISTAVSGYGIVRLRFNTAGVVAITSPVAATLAIGNGSPTAVNACDSEEASLSEGWEFAAATGIGISVQGFTAVTAAAVGYVLVSVTGYEY